MTSCQLAGGKQNSRMKVGHAFKFRALQAEWATGKCKSDEYELFTEDTGLVEKTRCRVAVSHCTDYKRRVTRPDCNRSTLTPPPDCREFLLIKTPKVTARRPVTLRPLFGLFQENSNNKTTTVALMALPLSVLCCFRASVTLQERFHIPPAESFSTVIIAVSCQDAPWCKTRLSTVSVSLTGHVCVTHRSATGPRLASALIGRSHRLGRGG